MTLRKHICVISLAMPIETDPRTGRQVEGLLQAFDVTLISFGRPSENWVLRNWYPINMHASHIRKLTEICLLFLGKWIPGMYDLYFWTRPRYRQSLRYAVQAKAHAYHASDWATLAIAVKAAKRNNARVVYDVDEYYTLLKEDNRLWAAFFSPLIHHIQKRFSPAVDQVLTVSAPLAERYEKQYQKSSIILYNAPNYVSVSFHDTDPNDIRLIHHGAGARNRQIEAMIDAMQFLDKRYSLVLLLYNFDTNYFEELKTRSEAIAPNRIEFWESVPYNQVVRTISNCDIELCLIAPVTFTYQMTLPNKIFEAAVAGLAVCVGPSPAMAELVQFYKYGIVTADYTPQSIADALNKLTVDQIRTLRQAALEAAKILNAEVEQKKLLNIYHLLFNI